MRTILDELEAALATHPGPHVIQWLEYSNPNHDNPFGTASADHNSAVLLLGNDLAFTDCASYDLSLIGLDDVINCVAKEKGATPVDAYTPFQQSCTAGDCFSDSLHPNDRGYGLIFDAFRDTPGSAVPATPPPDGGWPFPPASQPTAFSYTGGEQTYTVPAAVSDLYIRAIGGPGGGPMGSGLPGGRAADVGGMVGVTPGQVLEVEVGGAGAQPGGGFNGGGAGASGQGVAEYGGGGASDVRTLPMSYGASSLSSRLVVAAGGGGSSDPAAAGGDAGAPGVNGPGGNGAGGGAGTQSSGGVGGCGLSGVGCGTDGGLGIGGVGGFSGSGASQRAAGGGGGGLYGGGGGGAAAAGSVGGGGGGASEVPSELGTIGLANVTTAPSIEITVVPAPTCEDVVLSTPVKTALGLQLNCFEFAALPLTFAIVGGPAHGTLSTIGASGQVSYKPAAGFLGHDSFTYDASSPDGTSSVDSVLIAVGSPAVATAGHAKGTRTGVKVAVTCTGLAGTGCSVMITMTVTETFAGKKLIAVTSATSNRSRKTKVVTVGRTSVSLRAGTRRMIDTHLNAMGHRLLATRGRIRVAILVSEAASPANLLVSRQTLTLTTKPGHHTKTG